MCEGVEPRACLMYVFLMKMSRDNDFGRWKESLSIIEDKMYKNHSIRNHLTTFLR